MSEYDVFGRHILTSNDGPRVVRIKPQQKQKQKTEQTKTTCHAIIDTSK